MAGEPVRASTRAWRGAVSLMLPGVFVLLWSTGFVFAKLGLPFIGPFTFLEIRYVIVAALLTLLSLATSAPWPKRDQILPISIGGLLVHAGYLGGVFAAISGGVEAGVAALVAGLQPVLTAALAGPFLGERVSPRQWLGLALGFCGVMLVVHTKLGMGLGTPWGMALSAFAMASITAGTLWQKRYCGGMDLRTGSVVQFAASALVTLPLAIGLEGMRVEWAPNLIFALAWLCLVLSIGAITAMFILIRRGKASEVSSLFFLVPPTTAVIAWFMFHEKLEPLSIAGMALVMAAVAMVTWKPARG